MLIRDGCPMVDFADNLFGAGKKIDDASIVLSYYLYGVLRRLEIVLGSIAFRRYRYVRRLQVRGHPLDLLGLEEAKQKIGGA
jgi:hypothetical protein